MGGVPHHCLDIVSPKKIFTVVDFKKCADEAIEKIFAKIKRRLSSAERVCIFKPS